MYTDHMKHIDEWWITLSMQAWDPAEIVTIQQQQKNAIFALGPSGEEQRYEIHHMLAFLVSCENSGLACKESVEKRTLAVRKLDAWLRLHTTVSNQSLNAISHARACENKNVPELDSWLRRAVRLFVSLSRSLLFYVISSSSQILELMQLVSHSKLHLRSLLVYATLFFCCSNFFFLVNESMELYMRNFVVRKHWKPLEAIALATVAVQASSSVL